MANNPASRLYYKNPLNVPIFLEGQDSLYASTSPVPQPVSVSSGLVPIFKLAFTFLAIGAAAYLWHRRQSSRLSSPEDGESMLLSEATLPAEHTRGGGYMKDIVQSSYGALIQICLAVSHIVSRYPMFPLLTSLLEYIGDVCYTKCALEEYKTLGVCNLLPFNIGANYSPFPASLL
jgi:hypothetical protein